MQFIDLSYNNLSGISTIFDTLNLTELDISFNILSEPLPGSLANMTSLERLNLCSNFLSGPLPTFSSNLQSLNLFNNSFQGLKNLKFKAQFQVRLTAYLLYPIWIFHSIS